MNIFGIPSFVVTQKGQELGRLVNKARKTKEEINAFDDSWHVQYFKIYKRTIEGEPMIFAYNKEQVGDVLLVILEDTKDIKRSVERKGKWRVSLLMKQVRLLLGNILKHQASLILKGNGKVFYQTRCYLNENWLKRGL